jgi:hypothetical protein
MEGTSPTDCNSVIENGKNEISAGLGPKIAYFVPPDLTQKKTKEYKRIVLDWRTCVLSTGTIGLCIDVHSFALAHRK